MSADERRPAGGELVWHYTTGRNLRSILADGMVLPACDDLEVAENDSDTLALLASMRGSTGAARLFEQRPGLLKERPGVWFSKHPVWEPTATKHTLVNGLTGERSRITFDRFAELFGLARIGVVNTGLHTWLEHRKVSGISAAKARRLVLTGVGDGANPGDWLVHYGAVPRTRWVVVQRWNGKVWGTECGVTPSQLEAP